MDRFTNTKRERYAQKILASRKSIKIDDALIRGLQYQSTREFFHELGSWGYNTDFGRFPEATDSRSQSYLRAFIRDNFIN